MLLVVIVAFALLLRKNRQLARANRSIYKANLNVIAAADRERQMRADRMVTLIRSRYGYAAVQRGIMHEDRYLSSLNATAEDHMIHPHSYLEHGNRSGCEAALCAEGR